MNVQYMIIINKQFEVDEGDYEMNDPYIRERKLIIEDFEID